MTSDIARPAWSARSEAAERDAFALGRSRLPVLVFSAALFAVGAAVLTMSPPLALTIGLWCGYCAAFAAIAAARRATSGLRLHGLTIASIAVGAVAGRGVEQSLWRVDGLGGIDQALRGTLHLAFVTALIIVPVVRSAANARRVERLEAERARVTAHLMMLQAQIEPHFLFNTLATLRSLMRRDAVVAGELLERMTVFLRAVLPDARQTTSTVARELTIVESYLAIMQVRLGDRLRYAIDAAPATLAASVPPLLLQPLVENAIKHGIEPSETGGRIDVRTVVEHGVLIIEIANTGEPLRNDGTSRDDAVDTPRTGLMNVRNRLAALHADDDAVSLISAQGGVTVATLRLPLTHA